MITKKYRHVPRRRLQGAARQAYERRLAGLAEEQRRASEEVSANVLDVSNQVHPPTQSRGDACYTCLEQLSSSNAPRNITIQCEHSIRACHQCLRKCVIAQAESTTLDKIRCPECHAILQYQNMQEFAPADLLNRWELLQIRKAIPTDERFICCAHEGCNFGGVCNPAVDSFVICSGCNHRTCVSCETPHHDGLTCAEAKKGRVAERQREENKTENYFAENKDGIKICPNKECGAALMKSDGCDHFTCSHCRFQFCWICRAPWADIMLHGNHYHHEDCRHYHLYRSAYR